MWNVGGSKSIYRSKGFTVRPVEGGWKPVDTLTFERFFEFQIERDEEGWFVGTVPELPGCYTQARTKRELIHRLREAIELALEESGDPLTRGLLSSKQRR